MADARVAVIVASRQRAGEVEQLLGRLALQTLPPRWLILSGVEASDMPSDPERLLPGVECHVATSAPGLCRQRNAGLEALSGEVDIVLFYDDDYVPSRFALEDAAAVFSARPDVVGITGNVLADGVTSGGIAFEEAERIVAAHDAGRAKGEPATALRDASLAGLYGCNMAFRTSAIGRRRFDERLPLYGWLEDLDFSRRVGEEGLLARTRGFAGVHRGVTHGRSPGKRLGYSQVANPAYLLRKGTISRGFFVRQVSRNVIANHARSFVGTEAWIDRRGRTAGNWSALVDLLRGRIDPERALSIDR